MTCACGHHHPHRPHSGAGGVPLALSRPMVGISGRLVCADAGQMMTALSLLPDHLALTRAEPGCLGCDMWQDDDPMVWHLAQLFADDDALAAHHARAATSPWGREGGAIARELHRHEVTPLIRPEIRRDPDAIDALLCDTFGGRDEAALVRKLREDGDLSRSLVVDAAGTLLGQATLTPLVAEQPAYLLAPVAVHPKVQGRGLGAALIREAVGWADPAAVVVIGNPGYYGTLGFRPVRLNSPYGELSLGMIGDLPGDSRIQHARAFHSL